MKVIFKKTAYMLLALIILASAISVSPANVAEAASKAEIQYFLDTLGPMVTQDMKDNKILASFSMAQAIYESGWGTSTLAKNANALFGIKAYSNWAGKVYDRNECVFYQSWAELVEAKGSDYVKKFAGSFWRAYDSWLESVNDHSALFNKSSLYVALRGNYDYKSCAYAVVEAGYCTSSTYAPYIIKLIEQYELTKYDYYGEVTEPSSSEDSGESSEEESPAPEEPVYASSLALNPKKLYIDEGMSCMLSSSFAPIDAELVWSSSNESVATIEFGTLRTLSEGETTISLSSGRLSVSCLVTVRAGYGCIVSDGVYVKCTGISPVAVIPLEATKIAASAFSGVSGITEILIGKTVEEIEVGAFSGISGGYSLFSLGNSVATDFASENLISCRSISPTWSLDSSAKIIKDIPLKTPAAILKNYFAFENASAKVYSANGALLSDTNEIYIGTGCTVTINDEDYEVVIKGDIIGNGEISDLDFNLMKSYFSNEKALKGAYLAAADYDGDGTVTTADYLSMRIDG